jgi:hypothetical protein
MYMIFVLFITAVQESYNLVSQSDSNVLMKIFCFIILFFQSIYYASPYFQAQIPLTYDKYKETTMYADRANLFGTRGAHEFYTNNEEFFFFRNKLTFTDKLKALFIPYTYIDRKGGETGDANNG